MVAVATTVDSFTPVCWSGELRPLSRPVCNRRNSLGGGRRGQAWTAPQAVGIFGKKLYKQVSGALVRPESEQNTALGFVKLLHKTPQSTDQGWPTAGCNPCENKSKSPARRCVLRVVEWWHVHFWGIEFLWRAG